ncbi:MAG TPA: lipocalin-like domain-containing protein, partial [Pseudonocardiaceae bacterium]|nr:lipocalin-like domain-containing protein [Pseudonocardiaceae bacterium]
SLHDVDDAGTTSEGPLGTEPRGVLVYTSTGLVSVHMMSTRGEPRYMGYAGTWRLTDGRAVHTIAVTPRPDWVDTEQPRDVALDGDRLVLHGTTLVAGRPQRRELVWQRATRPTREEVTTR